jgi:predicted protein tyrosine phosphatase
VLTADLRRHFERAVQVIRTHPTPRTTDNATHTHMQELTSHTQTHTVCKPLPIDTQTHVVVMLAHPHAHWGPMGAGEAHAANKRVLVHCQAGISRCAPVLPRTAHLYRLTLVLSLSLSLARAMQVCDHLYRVCDV